MKSLQTIVPVLALSFACIIVPNAQADLLGTVPAAPSDTVFPGLVAPGTDPGILLASLTDPFTSTLGTTGGTLISAVFMEAGGTLDFYYQVINSMTAPNCGSTGQSACDPISRETDTTFTGFSTALGFRVDGSALPGGIFSDGTVAPVTGDRNSVGDVVGFSFQPPDPAKIQPGQTSNVLVISTNATNFKAGNASVIDGGVTTVASFEPAMAPSKVPEPASIVLLGAGLLLVVSFRRSRA